MQTLVLVLKGSYGSSMARTLSVDVMITLSLKIDIQEAFHVFTQFCENRLKPPSSLALRTKNIFANRKHFLFCTGIGVDTIIILSVHLIKVSCTGQVLLN